MNFVDFVPIHDAQVYAAWRNAPIGRLVQIASPQAGVYIRCTMPVQDRMVDLLVGIGELVRGLVIYELGDGEVPVVDVTDQVQILVAQPATRSESKRGTIFTETTGGSRGASYISASDNDGLEIFVCLVGNGDSHIGGRANTSLNLSHFVSIGICDIRLSDRAGIAQSV